jgi:hypothetical protein
VSHRYSFAEYRGSRSASYETCMSVQAAASDEWVPEPVKARARRLLEASAVECSEDWVRSVYAYFRNCYSPDGVDRNVSRCVIPKGDDPTPEPTRHLAYLCVRSHFSEHEPRVDLIKDPPAWGRS